MTKQVHTVSCICTLELSLCQFVTAVEGGPMCVSRDV